jgi:hypothetical protein
MDGVAKYVLLKDRWIFDCDGYMAMSERFSGGWLTQRDGWL